jgi:D-serine deaminase-like pyridoxal phosphate-dependent protein
MEAHDLPTPALVIEADALEANLATMAAAHPGTSLRPHVKAHKCTALAARQRALGHTAFTCATPREAVGLAAAGLGADILVANEVVDPRRLTALAALDGDVHVTIAVDSEATIDAAVLAGVRACLVDVDVGLPRCGCDPGDAGRLAELARRRGLDVRGVMGYEGHLMVLDDRGRQRDEVAAAMERLRAAHADVGGDIVSAGGTGTYDLHGSTGVTEIQAGSYALMDTYYATLGLPFGQALHVVGTVISVRPEHAVADVGLKALGMDHGNPSIDGATVWFCSDEHVTFAADAERPAVGDRIRVVPAHVDPTMTMHEVAWLARDGTVVDRWPIDLRGWG